MQNQSNLLKKLFLVSPFAITIAHAGVTITGDPTTSLGLDLILAGNSQDAALMADNTGVGYAYDVYFGRYTVSADDVVSGSDIIGNTGEGVYDEGTIANPGVFNLGDEIFVIGWKATTQNAGGTISNESDAFLKIDANNNGGYAPISSLGGASTSFTTNSDAGDYQISSSRNDFNEFRPTSFRFLNSSGTSIYPYQAGGASNGNFNSISDTPLRAFGVLANPPTSQFPRMSSQLYFLNITDLNAAEFDGTPTNDITDDDFVFYMQQGNLEGKTGVVVTAILVTVPEPSVLLCSLLGLLGMRRRR